MRHVQLIAISGGMSQYQRGYGYVLMSSNWSCIIRFHWWTAYESCSNCLIEIATLIPVDGGFVTYANRYVEKSFSMALGWNVRPLHFISCNNRD
jgi:amino acid transporter